MSEVLTSLHNLNTWLLKTKRSSKIALDAPLLFWVPSQGSK